jgi:hypothetical protein
MRFILDWPGNQPPPNELIKPLVLKGATLSQIPQIRDLAIPEGKPLTNMELEAIIDASIASKANPKKEVLKRIAGKINSQY